MAASSSIDAGEHPHAAERERTAACRFAGDRARETQRRPIAGLDRRDDHEARALERRCRTGVEHRVWDAQTLKRRDRLRRDEDTCANRRRRIGHARSPVPALRGRTREAVRARLAAPHGGRRSAAAPGGWGRVAGREHDGAHPAVELPRSAAAMRGARPTKLSDTIAAKATATRPNPAISMPS